MLAAAAVGLAGGAPPQARTRRWADGGCSIQVLAPLALDAGSRLGAPPPCLAASTLLEHAVALAAGRRSCCPAPARIAAKRRPRCSVPTHHGGGVSEEKVADIRLGGDPGAPSPRLVCATATGCRLFKLIFEEFTVRIIPRDAPPLESVGPQKCLAFSTDGAKFAIGGEDGHLRIFHWPSVNVLLDEPKAHKSFRDMDISLGSEFLVSTSTDGSARIWKIDEGAPLVNLTRSSDEKIECCRFSRDGMKPFLFCTVAKGSKVVTVVWNVSDWKRIGYKRLLGKPISTFSVSLDGKYLALGSNDGDFCAVDVKKMEVSHWSKKVHLGSSVTSIEFCPTERVVISTSHQWGAELTKLNVPADWKEWQVWLVLLALFLASAILFYVFYERSDTFWNFPMGRHQPAKPFNVLKESPPVPEDQNPW